MTTATVTDAPSSTGTRTHRVALTFEDGVTRFVNCRQDQRIADASYRSRINIPVDCSDGACGTCKAFCESGDYDGGSYIEDALSEDEAAQGYLLACQATPRSDMVLQIPTTSAVARTSAATHRGRVTAVHRLTTTTVDLRIEIDKRDELAFLPGQYVNIAVPGTDVTRSYSFANGPDDDELSFLVKITPGGRMSDYLDQRAAVGDEIELTGPHGSFFLRESETPLLLLAGGTGLAPILSILRTLEATGSSRPVHLFYGATTDEDVVEQDTLRALAETTGMTWDYCVADANTTARNRGYVTALIGAEHLHDGDAAVYLCGPPPMVEAVRTFFAEEGHEPSGFYYEKFALAAAPDGQAGGKAEPEPDAVAPDTERSGAAASVGADGPAAGTEEPAEPETALAVPAHEADGELLTLAGREGRGVLGQEVTRFGEVEPLYSGGRPEGVGSADSVWRINGQQVGTAFAADAEVSALDEDAGPVLSPDARAVQGQEFGSSAGLRPLVDPAPAPAPAAPGPHDAVVVPDGYEIGEEHPSIHESDAIFDARQGLELGALELTIGRLSTQQIAGYRLLAESTVPYVDVASERFTDAHAYTETNAAFHDYLFTLTGNEHLLHAYRALGVKGAMEETLRSAVWCHPHCAQDHLDIVDAFEAGDREAARTLIVEHARNSKATMRRAMRDRQESKRPRFVTPGRFAGLVVLVTGAAQGIGECTARRISAEGGTLVLADRAEQVDELAHELGGSGNESGPPALAVTADLETWEGAVSVVSAAIEEFGRIDVAIHTVGGTIWAKPFEQYPPEQIEAEINRSLWPTLWCCRAVAPHMIENGGGTILNVSSVATRGLNRVPYAAAKGGVNAITSTLAMELAPHGVRVLATAPGGTDAPARRIPRGPAPESEQEREWYATIVEQTTESSLLKRYGTLDEQAAAITFLASPEASYITGTVLPVAGGDQG